MPTVLNPYLSFTDNAREAMEFYHSVFGGELTINTFAEYGGAPEGMSDDGVMHANLASPNGITLMASDTPPEMASAPGSTISISLSGEDETELRGYWDKLSADGTVTMPLEKQMWGDVFGMCTDRFGIAWMVNIAGEAA